MGSTRNGRDSNAQRLGIKKYGGEIVKAGNILIRQKGTKIHPGHNVGLGKDYTIFSLIDGRVLYQHCGAHKRKVSVYPVKCSISKDGIPCVYNENISVQPIESVN